MQPYRVVAGAVSENGVFRQVLAQLRHDLPQIELAWYRPRRLPAEIIAMRFGGTCRPRCCAERFHRSQRCAEQRNRRLDREGWLIHLAELVAARMNVDQGLLWIRRGKQRVAASDHLAYSLADHQQDIGLAHARCQCRVNGDAELAWLIR